MTKILIILTIILSSSSFAKNNQDLYDVLQNRIDKFYGKEINMMNPENPNLPQMPLYKAGACLKFNKDGETFWNKYETMTILIEEIGKNKIKIRKVFFMSDKKWLTGSPEVMSFQAQSLFTQTDCPSEKMKLTEEEIYELKQKNQLKNVK